VTTKEEKEVIDEEVTKAVLALQERDGVAAPEAFVNMLADEDHPLHGQLEWDDAVAGHEYRKWQARQLIGRVKISLDGSRTPAFVHVHITRDGERREGYLPIEVVANDADLEAQVIAEAAAGLNGWSLRLAGIRRARAALPRLHEAVALLREEGAE
jgi:hypothetical protein